MIKAIALLHARKDMSRHDFIDYYENRHAPLARSIAPQMTDYRRNYLNLEQAFLFPGAALPNFDVITEISWPDRQAYDAAMAAMQRPDNAARLAEDEAKLFDRDRICMFLVDEYRTAF
jgi:hypothetical protein